MATSLKRKDAPSSTIALFDLLPGSSSQPGASDTTFGGQITRATPFNPNSKIFSIAITTTNEEGKKFTIDVDLHGEWAREPSRLLTLNLHVKFLLSYAEIREKKRKDEDAQKWKLYSVRFMRKVCFSTCTSLEEDDWTAFVEFPANGPTPTPSAPSSSKESSSSSVGSANGNSGKNATTALQVKDPNTTKSAPAQGAPREKKRGGKEIKLWEKGALKVGSTIYAQLKTIMAEAPPKTYSLIGVAIPSSKPEPAPGSHTGDWKAPLHVYDPTAKDEYLGVNLFAKGDAHCPHVGAAGAIIILRGVKKTTPKARAQWDNQLTGYKDSCYFSILSFDDLLSGKVVPDNTNVFPHASYGEQEIAYAKELAEWWQSLNKKIETMPVEQLVTKPLASAVVKSLEIASRKTKVGKRKLDEIREMQVDRFSDLFVEVVRVYCDEELTYVNDESEATLFVTDYTKNDDLFLYGPESDRSTGIPFGQITLQLSIRGEANVRAILKSKIKPGSIIHCRNVRGKLNANDLLEANLWADNKFPNRTDIEVYSPGGEYATAYEGRHAALIQRKNTFEGNGNQDEPADVHMMEEEVEEVKPRLSSNSRSPSAPQVARAPQVAPRPSASLVECKYHSQPFGTMLLAQNAKVDALHHLRGQIVNFSPDRIEEWTTADCAVCQKEVDAAMEECCGSTPILQYWFRLVIREEPKSGSLEKPSWIKVDVMGKDALEFLPGLPPSLGTRQGNCPQLNLLRNRVTPLLGNLEANKRRKSKSTAEDYGPFFEFAVANVGSGDRRMLLLKGTSLKEGK